MNLANSQQPLRIEYLVDYERGLWIGWSMNRNKISQRSPYQFVLSSRQEIGLVERERLPDFADKEVRRFFNGPLTADLRIPEGYPYELYEFGAEAPCKKGKLRT